MIGRLGMGGDTVAVLNTISVLKEKKKIQDFEIDFLTHDIGYNKKKVEDLQNFGYKVIILSGDVRKEGPLKYFMDIKKAIKKNGPYDIIHTHTSLQSGVALFAAMISGVPKRVCHSHTNSVQRHANLLVKLIMTPMFKWLIKTASTDKVACGMMAGRFLYGNSKFKVINNGINIEKFLDVTKQQTAEFRKYLGVNEETFIVGHVGRFSEMKNQRFIMNIAEKLKHHVEILFVLVGDGENLNEISNYAIEKNLNVMCIGRRNDIPILMRTFDLLLLPSLEGEGFPITLVESQAAMCPCIVSDKVTKEADLGLKLLRYESLDNIEKWISLITKKKKRREWDKNSIERIRENALDDDNAAETWLKLYKN